MPWDGVARNKEAYGQHMSKMLRGKKLSVEHCKKLRIAAIRHIEKNYGIRFPSYNKRACEYFKKFDEAHNTKGKYAVYGGGEYKIEEFGYFVDYINFDLKLIIEYDESWHYINGKLREKDVKRQKEIQQVFHDFEFRRIKDMIV